MTALAHILTVEGREVRVPASAFDHRGFRAWATSEDFPPSVRATFVAAEVLVDMSPEEIETHNKVKSAVTAALWDHVEREQIGELCSDGVLLTNEPAQLSTEPDLVFLSWASFEQGRVTLVEKSGDPNRYVELVGVPDLVVEIVSDSSVRKDTKLLRAAYENAGIPEYWLIDARGDAIAFEILQLENSRYRSPVDSGSPQPSRVLGGQRSLSRRRNRLGRFTYRLSNQA